LSLLKLTAVISFFVLSCVFLRLSLSTLLPSLAPTTTEERETVRLLDSDKANSSQFLDKRNRYSSASILSVDDNESDMVLVVKVAVLVIVGDSKRFQMYIFVLPMC